MNGKFTESSGKNKVFKVREKSGKSQGILFFHIAAGFHRNKKYIFIRKDYPVVDQF